MSAAAATMTAGNHPVTQHRHTARKEVQMNPVPAFPSAADAMAAVQAGLRLLAAADATRMPAQAQAEALQMMERATAIVTAARASALAAFTSGQGYSADADYSPRAWLTRKRRVTKAAAVAHTAWARRTATHPQVVAALADGDLPESYGRTICPPTGNLPGDCRPAADAILLSAARAGMDLRDLPGWPPRCTSGPGPARNPAGASRTARSGCRRPSRAPAS